jgi:diguanylate cyclase (GGDEF)-like protein
MRLDLGPRSWGRVIASTALGTIVCVAAAVWVDSFNFADMDAAGRFRALATDIGLPIVLAVPLLLFFTGKLRELAITHYKLTVYASTDSLTQVMNRSAFATLVDAYLNDVRNRERRLEGTLLIIDADNFKAVNDRYGHDRGDEALVTIAGSIKSTLRSVDLVGRLGGDEFGVFLPGADPNEAEAVAERIRQSVNTAMFVPGGAPYQLSVSVGGAVFETRLPFTELFRLADQQLYRAKRDGRNRVAIKPVGAGALTVA